MDIRPLIQWSGLATILFGALMAVAALLQLVLDPTHGSAAHLSVGTLELSGLVLGVFAATGIYARHARATGVAALGGYALAAVGLILTAANTMFFTYIEPWVVEQAPQIADGIREGTLAPPAAHVALVTVADVALISGLVLLLGAIGRTGLLPRAALWIALAGGVLAVAGGYVLAPLSLAGVVVFGAATVWLGYAMWSRPTPPTATDVATA